jgi:hypothetical protein
MGAEMNCACVAAMENIERRYQAASGLPNRSHYKIFYGPVRPGHLLVLGINPGGAPKETSADGRTHTNGTIAAASASYYENNEHDLLDCKWPENDGLLKLLRPLSGGDDALIRSRIVKTNLAFRRSAKKKDIDIDAAIEEAAPFLQEIIGIVRPEWILLAGVKLSVFAKRFADKVHEPEPAIRDEDINQTVFAAAKVVLKKLGTEAIAVQVAHASRFAGTYKKYGVVEKIKKLGLTL